MPGALQGLSVKSSCRSTSNITLPLINGFGFMSNVSLASSSPSVVVAGAVVRFSCFCNVGRVSAVVPIAIPDLPNAGLLMSNSL